jgi:hypothetical protein
MEGLGPGHFLDYAVNVALYNQFVNTGKASIILLNRIGFTHKGCLLPFFGTVM